MPVPVSTILGLLLVLGAITEVFQDLFHPSRSGTLSDVITRGIFSVLRRWPKVLPPLCVVNT
jgi:hypothetical protein